MKIQKLDVNARVARLNTGLEKNLNTAVRRVDGLLARAHLGGRKALYDDEAYEFVGGARDSLRRKHYDKSLRLLWKAEQHAPWLSFQDANKHERSLLDMAERSLTDEEKAARQRLSLPEFRALLNREYSEREKRAIVSVLSAIGHGEAYAWIVSAELLGEVKSTGARAALTMQVVEEAKHFVVLRELLQAFDVPIPRQSAWEYMLLEGVLKAKGLEKFFGMNVVVEGIALSLFGLMSHMPGLEVLRLFHLDESRHTGLPSNYFKEFPLSRWQKLNPASQLRRLNLILPALGLIPYLEEDLAELGIDAFEFGGSVLRKVSHLAERNGFHFGLPRSVLLAELNLLFNGYCKLTRRRHTYRDFMASDTTRGEHERAVEREIFFDDPAAVVSQRARSPMPPAAVRA